MKSGKPIRWKSLREAALALVTVLAVLIAPVCAPLCAARACEKAGPEAGSHKKCHGMNMAEKDEEPRLVGNSVKPCNRGELPAATLKSSKSQLGVRDRRDATADPVIVVNLSAASSPVGMFQRWGSRGGGLKKFSGNGVTSSVLRI